YSLSIQYDVGSAQNVPATANNPSPPVTGTGSVHVSAGDVAKLPTLDSILQSPFANSAAPGTQERSGTVTASQAYAWTQTWCAVDAQTLANNLPNIVVRFAVNDEDVDSSLIRQQSTTENQLSCNEYSVMLSDWTPGNVTLTAALILNSPVFDGQ